MCMCEVVYLEEQNMMFEKKFFSKNSLLQVKKIAGYSAGYPVSGYTGYAVFGLA